MIGDACYDRLAASKNSRALYRQTLGAGHRHRLVLVCSTWGPASLLGQDWDLLEGLVGGLPGDEYRVALLLHPNVWSTYGEWQIRGWLAGLGRRGLTVVGQDADWTGVMAAADYVVGDHGSVPLYGMLAGVPVLVTEAQESGVDPGSPMAELRSLAPRLRTDRLYPSQLRRSHAAYTPHTYERLASRITSEPGRFARNMRALMYQKLRMRPPMRPPGDRTGPFAHAVVAGPERRPAVSGPAGHRSPAARYELVRSSWSGAALHVRVTLWGKPGRPWSTSTCASRWTRLPPAAPCRRAAGTGRGARRPSAGPLSRGGRGRPAPGGPRRTVVARRRSPPDRFRPGRTGARPAAGPDAGVAHACFRPACRARGGESPQAALGLPLVGQPSPSAVTRARQARTT